MGARELALKRWGAPAGRRDRELRERIREFIDGTDSALGRGRPPRRKRKKS